ncbi:uroporphyrinogen decarboxylase family protein [Chloroflexota bacterium]
MAAPEHIMTLTGCSADEYWAAPFHWGLEAERVLGSDGVIVVFEPIVRGEYRIVDEEVLEERAAYSLDDVVTWIEKLPDGEAIKGNYGAVDHDINPTESVLIPPSLSADEAYAVMTAELKDKQAQCGAILWSPADWSAIPNALWYHVFGYENALMLPLLYPELWRKLFRLTAEKARMRNELSARAMQEGLLPRSFLTGEDLCGQTGPMIAPEFLRKEYFPVLEYVLEPLFDSGARLVWHSDGDIRPIFDDVLACGFAGFQGFQQECGVDIEWIVKNRSKKGEPLLIFGPLSVTQTLPHGTPADVRAEVKRAMDVCRDQASLVFFTANTINPDVPLDNIKTFWDTVRASSWS